MKKSEDRLHIVENEILIYQTEDGQTKIDVKFEDETVWLTQAQLCELYQTSKSNISEHIKHIFEEGELEEKQLFGNSEQLLLMGKIIIQHIIILI
jgi:Virulence protein